MRSKNLIFALLLGGALAAAALLLLKTGEPAELKSALVFPAPIAVPQFSLIDQSGNTVNADTFRGHWNLLFFGFTHCPDVCPTTLQTLSNAKRALVDAGADIVPRIVLVSVDPERDTAEVLGKYINYFGPDNLGLTGELEEIRKLTAALGIYFEKTETDDENYGVDHSAAILIIDPDAKFSGLFSSPHIAANFVHDLPIVVTAK